MVHNEVKGRPSRREPKRRKAAAFSRRLLSGGWGTLALERWVSEGEGGMFRGHAMVKNLFDLADCRSSAFLRCNQAPMANAA